jgi:hypothetical protein
MESSQKEMARRALEAALDRLATEPSGEGRQANSCGCGQSARGDDGAVVLIMLGPASLHSSERASIREETVSSGPIGSRVQPREQSALHPGLERFALQEGEPNASAVKACFMEPDRDCVNSGACEMRGY